MKKLALVVLILGFSVGVNATTCTDSDLKGKWLFKAIIKSPPQVMSCNITIDNALVTSGSCYNPTYYITSDIFDGKVAVKSNCYVTGKIVGEDGSQTTINLKLDPSGGVMTGTGKQIVGSRKFNGAVTAVKQLAAQNTCK